MTDFEMKLAETEANAAKDTAALEVKLAETEAHAVESSVAGVLRISA